ncbi:MAG: hypothetical protein K0R83_1051, partial [Caulobacter sp.]|nr:hypothetical protein [Caulobacter sp.]
MFNKDRSRVFALRFGASLAAMTVALAAAGYASAQETAAEGEEVEEVVIKGCRGALASAVEVKRNETTVVDSIKAEDIADFPDLNLAESIQRIPGVSIDRDAGEGRSITVRGLGADFTRTRINGMEAQATTGGTDSSGGANRGRGFDFNVFASELFNSITIRKTAAAETEEGSLGATVDLRTTRPFDYDGFQMAMSGQYGFNDLSENWDPRLAFLVSNRFFDDKIGVLASIAYSERNLLEEGFSSVRWERGIDNGGFCSPLGYAPQNPGNNVGNGSTAANCATGLPRLPNTADNNAAYAAVNSADVFHPRLPRYGRLVHQQERLGFTGAVQFKPTDDTTFSYDVLYSKLDATRQENFLEALSFSRNAGAGGKTQIRVRDAVVENGELVYGLFDNVDVRTEQRYDELSTEFTQHTLTFDHRFNDRFKMRAYVGSATSEFDNPVQTTVTLDRQNTQGFSWDFRGNGDTPRIDYGFDVSDPASWAWRQTGLSVPRSEIRLRPNGVETVFQSAQLDFTFDAYDWLTLKFGYNYKTFESDSFDKRRTTEDVVPALPPGTTVADISKLLTGFGSGLGQPGGNDRQWLVPDLNAIARLFDIYCNCNTGVPGGDFTLTGITNGNARGGNRFIREEDRAWYLQGDFRFDLFWDMKLRGNVGIRAADTRLYAEGYSSSAGGIKVHGTNQYEDFLPSLNLALNATEDFVVRF